jgi:hypothetical protein
MTRWPHEKSAKVSILDSHSPIGPIGHIGPIGPISI